MKFSDAFDSYTTEIASVYTYRYAIRGAADRELDHLMEQDKHREQANLSPDQVVGMQNLSFRTADTGHHHFYSFKDNTIQAQLDALAHRTNRQYQWLLAEAYELFEDFLEHAYACAAMENKNLWPLRDYGSISLDELDSITFDKLLKQAKAKRDKPQSLLHPLREKLPRIKALETSNRLQVNLWFVVNFVEKLRHHIVHTKGIVADKQKFTADLLEKVGLYNNGKPDPAYLEFIDLYLCPRGGAHFVRLLEVALPSSGHFRKYVDVFGDLSDYLVAYAHVLVTTFTPVQSKQPTSMNADT